MPPSPSCAGCPTATGRCRAAGDATGLLEIVRGAEAISRRFAQLHDEVEKAVLVFVRPPYVVEDENDAEKQLLARGLAARAVYDVDVLETPGGGRRATP